jgi:uncharacterized protein YacL
MKKENKVMNAINAFSRGALIGMLVCLMINFAYHTNSFYVGSNELTILYGTNISILIMIIFSGMLSLVASLSSSIFKNENRSLLQNTALHFIMVQIVLVLLALLLNMKNIYLSLFLIGTIIYVIIWIVIYSTTKKEIKEMNEILKNRK